MFTILFLICSLVCLVVGIVCLISAVAGTAIWVFIIVFSLICTVEAIFNDK